MSLLTIAQNVAEQIPINSPTSVIGNRSRETKLLLSCIQKAGEAISRRPEHGWVVQQIEYTFNTADGTAAYSLPTGFRYLINETLWDRSNYWELRGPKDPREWQQYKSSVLGNVDGFRRRFRIKGTSGTKEFYIDPTPSEVATLVFEYVSTTWCESSGGTAQTRFAADTDVAIIDEWLIELEALWRYLQRSGIGYEEEFNFAEREIDKAIARDGGAEGLVIGGHEPYHLITSSHAPDTGFGS